MPDKPFSAIMKQEGIPTADQEALQDPAIDPTQIAGLGVGFGPMAAGKMLFQQILMNAILPHLMNRITSLPAPPDSAQIGEEFVKYGAHKGAMLPSGVPYRTSKLAQDWLSKKMLQQEPGSRMDKLYSTILEKIPDWKSAAAKYSPRNVPIEIE